jgi:hypothetical protein
LQKRYIFSQLLQNFKGNRLIIYGNGCKHFEKNIGR